jgi:hypothetical protein
VCDCKINYYVKQRKIVLDVVGEEQIMRPECCNSKKKLPSLAIRRPDFPEMDSARPVSGLVKLMTPQASRTISPCE